MLIFGFYPFFTAKYLIMIRNFVTTVILMSVFLSMSCERTENYGENSFAFVTLLGKDTLAVEEVKIEPGKLSARAILRSPVLSYLNYEMGLDHDFKMTSFSAAAYKTPGTSDADLIERYDLSFSPDRDSISMLRRTNKEIIGYAFSTNTEVLPFLDMIHWPLDLMAGKMAAKGLDSLTQPMFSGRRTVDFVAERGGGDTLFIRHPTRGTMWSLIDNNGAIQYLDAGATTRKLKVYRTENIDFDGLARHFLNMDEAGKGIGELSGRGASVANIGGVKLEFDFGQPARRGRELFGNIVPWGKLWRTGANKATHLYLDGNIQIGGLKVPAGEYTLFTIPEAEGGMLIVNKQTGQNGQSYDPEQDLGRVPMQIGNLDESVELFSIDAAEEDPGQGMLRLSWGNTVFTVPITVL